MRREFSAGVVLVRAACAGAGGSQPMRPQGKREGRGRCRKASSIAGEKPAETALREGSRRPACRGRLGAKLGDVRYVYTWDGERVFKIVSFFLGARATRPDRRAAAGNGDRGRRGALARHSSRRAGCLAYKGEREMVATGPSRCSRATLYSCAAADADVRAQLLQPRWSPISCAPDRKTATIRLGDKSAKYQEGHDRDRARAARATGSASGSSTR